MAEYINRQDLLIRLADMQSGVAPDDKMQGIAKTVARIKWEALNDAWNAVCEVPVGNVIERKQGTWKPHYLDNGTFWANYCSECDTYLPYGRDWAPPFCPACGAEMEKEEEECVRGTVYTERDT